ncbi:LysM peptidoglycan-binding domain-containing protein [Bacillus mesophilus]|uniref:LysM peptidoglycan-binding domain-containing protein n=2 Tax=Bacillus mesophilus TaxID=1808955 RepID=A0A6M0Q9S7_9BACI|nr:LysM peptidoglycan-binding domain-containing protein [Bacillus mesophilus]
MAGAILLTTIGIGTFSSKSASAAMNQTTQQQANNISYIVVNGDTLSAIAARFGTSVEAIKQLNKLSSDFLRIGQTLTIPSSPSEIPLEQSTSNTYLVVSGDTLSAIAKTNGTTVEAIKQLNSLSSDFLRIGQTLTIPNGTNTSNTSNTSNKHLVVSGDTLSALANNNGTTVEAIKQLNNLSSDFLRIGQELLIPMDQNTNIISTSSHLYTVVSGDSLSSIAKDHGTTVNAIKQANGLSNDFIRIDQTLTIPTETNDLTVNDSVKSNSTIYQVVSGDTLSGIAAQTGTTVGAIKMLNQLNSDFLRIGQELRIPTATTTVTPSTNSPKETITAVNQEDLEWLAKMIYSEARGESLEGQIAVGAVIMNRVESPLFPNTVKEVLFQISNGHYQFTPAQTGSINTATPNNQNREAALRALNGEDPTNGSLYFYNPNKTSSVWLKSRTVSTTIGNHTFAY